MKKHRTPSKFYELRIFSRIQGKVIEICPVETWRVMTRKREAQVAANAYNREHYKDNPDKWVAPVAF
jgi:hypothetical protein